MAAATPEQLRRMAAEARARAELLIRQAEVYRRAADELEGLREHAGPPTVGPVFTDPEAHRINSSAGKSDDPLLVAARAAKPPHTMRTLAAAVGLSVAALSMARKGTRSIKRPKAEQIERLTGFAAVAANWPGGISD